MNDEAAVVDAEVVGEDTEIHATGTDLAIGTIRNEVIRALDPGEVKESMVAHQELLRQILDVSDWQGTPDAKGSFVKKSGWRKIALAYNLALSRVNEEVERDEQGVPQRASYTVRATAPNGRGVEATGHCAFAESRFSGNRGNTSKLENDMRATAETRAKNRAISDLIGMGKVSAEEVDAGAPPQAGPPHGEKADDDLTARAHKALAYLTDAGDHEGDNQQAADAVMAKIMEAYGYLPRAAAGALLHAAVALKAEADLTNATEEANAEKKKATKKKGDE